MQVYVLEHLFGGQGYEVVGVYSTLELAKASAIRHAHHEITDQTDFNDEWIIDCGPKQYSIFNHDVDA